MNAKLQEILKLAISSEASDVHLIEGMVPKLRVRGQLIEVNNFPDDSALIAEMILSTLSPDQETRFKQEKELDYSLEMADHRFRANAYFQQGRMAISLRVIPAAIPTFEELKLPEIFKSFVEVKQGFILVTGPTGTGKSTTVASILNEINKRRNCHIVTIEDPIEYIIKPENSIISQREIGFDTNDFARALRSSLRQDPNVVFVGEMRDLETISTALTVAETGHLVFSTLHTNSAAQTVDRIVDVFDQKEQVRVQLAAVISAIISQRLIPTLEGQLIPAFEILIATPAVKNCIREGKAFMLDNIIQTGADIGMVSLDYSLASLVKQGKVTEETAMSFSLKPSALQNYLREIKII
ncbi:MAG TPA: PilT/PilU family type 4a pilus ATPase [Candidatus Woesebacteria bacterium]|nr:PilT/PilU family type 4a pilus ATPase [Candidatus Woesebacteria bacterium]